MVQADGSIVSQRVLYQGIGILAVSLGQTLVFFGQIYTVTLNPSRNPSLVVARCCAVREIDFVSKLMIVALDANHVEQVNICRSCSQETVNNCVAGEHLVDEQRVHR